MIIDLVKIKRKYIHKIYLYVNLRYKSHYYTQSIVKKGKAMAAVERNKKYF